MNNLNFLVDVLKESPVFKTLEKNVKPGRTVCASGLSTINKSNIIYALCRLKGVTAFCLASDEKEAQTLCNDLSCMGLRAYVYPVRDFNFLDFQSRSHEYEHARLKVLLKLLNHECDVAIACVDAAAQLTVPRNVLEQSVIEFEEGRELSLEKATKALTLLGYERFDAVEGSGQFSLRGGILDFFMPDSDYPVRCEFWGDEITDLSYFDIETQRRFKKADKITLSPSTEIVIEDRAALADKIEHKAKLLRSKNSAKAKEKLFSEAELIRSGAMIANADKFINQIYDKPESLFDYLDRNTSFLRPNLLQFRNGESQWTLSAMKPLCKALRTELFAEVLTALRSHSTNVPSFCKVTEQSCLKTLFTEVCLSSCRKSSAFQQNSSRHGAVRINS